VAEDVAKAIDVKGFSFAQSMMDNSNELVRIINDASASAAVIADRRMLLGDGARALRRCDQRRHFAGALPGGAQQRPCASPS
jgi:hypothetical protein